MNRVAPASRDWRKSSGQGTRGSGATLGIGIVRIRGGAVVMGRGVVKVGRRGAGVGMCTRPVSNENRGPLEGTQRRVAMPPSSRRDHDVRPKASRGDGETGRISSSELVLCDAGEAPDGADGVELGEIDAGSSSLATPQLANRTAAITATATGRMVRRAWRLGSGGCDIGVSSLVTPATIPTTARRNKGETSPSGRRRPPISGEHRYCVSR